MKRIVGIALLVSIGLVAVGCGSGESDGPAANVKIGNPGDPGPKPSAPSGAGGGGTQSGASAPVKTD